MLSLWGVHPINSPWRGRAISLRHLPLRLVLARAPNVVQGAPGVSSGDVSRRGAPPKRFTNSGLKFPRIGAVLCHKGNTPNNYEPFRCSPASPPRSRHPAAPSLPLPAVPVRQLAKPLRRGLAFGQTRGRRTPGSAPHRIRMPHLPPPLSLARPEVLRGVGRRFRAGLYARRPLDRKSTRLNS